MINALTIPPKDRPEWQELLQGKLDYPFTNYVLQIKLHQVCHDIENGVLTPQAALDQIYELCKKYSVACQSDLIKIFKTW